MKLIKGEYFSYFQGKIIYWQNKPEIEKIPEIDKIPEIFRGHGNNMDRDPTKQDVYSSSFSRDVFFNLISLIYL